MNNKEMTDAEYCSLCMDINCDGCPYVDEENRWGKAIFKEQHDKDLLYLDICARLPHGVIVNIEGYNISKLKGIDSSTISTDRGINYPLRLVKPYLRPLSNLTQKERNKFCDIGGVISHRPDGKLYLVAYLPEALDYLNSIHVDYRGMIEKGLAIEVTDENNPYK